MPLRRLPARRERGRLRFSGGAGVRRDHTGTLRELRAPAGRGARRGGAAAAMIIRDAVAGDVIQIAPFFRAIVASGETYAYPEDLDDQGIADLWLERPPARCIVAVSDE